MFILETLTSLQQDFEQVRQQHVEIEKEKNDVVSKFNIFTENVNKEIEKLRVSIICYIMR